MTPQATQRRDCAAENGIKAVTSAGYVEPARPRPDPVAAVAYRGRMVLKEGERHRVLPA